MHRSWAEGELVINTAGKVRGKFFHERNMLDTSNSIYSNFPVNRKSRKLNISPSRDEGIRGRLQMFISIVTPEGRDGWPHRNGRIFWKVQIGLSKNHVAICFLQIAGTKTLLEGPKSATQVFGLNIPPRPPWNFPKISSVLLGPPVPKVNLQLFCTAILFSWRIFSLTPFVA